MFVRISASITNLCCLFIISFFLFLWSLFFVSDIDNSLLFVRIFDIDSSAFKQYRLPTQVQGTRTSILDFSRITTILFICFEAQTCILWIFIAYLNRMT